MRILPPETRSFSARGGTLSPSHRSLNRPGSKSGAELALKDYHLQAIWPVGKCSHEERKPVERVS